MKSLVKKWFFLGNASIHDRARVPPILPFLLAFIAGLFGSVAKFFIAPYLACVVTLILSIFFLKRSTKKISHNRLAILALLFAFGLLYPEKGSPPLDNIVHFIKEGKTTSVEGRLYSPPQVLKDRTFYLLEAESIETKTGAKKVSGRARIAVYKPHDLLQAGDKVRFDKVRLKIPRNFKNPDRFDYRSYLNSKGIHLIGNVSDPDTLVRLEQFDLPFHYTFPQQLREWMLASLSQLFPEDEGKLLQAMVFGMKDSLSPEIKEAYIATGLAHLTAVSGLHIGFVASAFYFLFTPLVFYLLYQFKPDSARAGHSGKWTAFLCLIPVLLYMIIVGSKVSSLRAGIMISVFLIAIIINRQNNLLNAFLSAAFFILLWKPESLINPGFQLSFLAVAGIIWVIHLLTEMGDDPLLKLGEPPWHQKLLGKESHSLKSESILSKLKKIFIGSALISFTVTLATLPVLLFNFNRISLAGVFLNLFLVPLAALLIPGVLLVTCIGVVSQSLAMLPSIPFIYLTKLFLIIPQFVAEFSWASIYLATPPAIWIVFYFAVLLSTGYALQHKVRHKEISLPFKISWSVAAAMTFAMLIWPRAFHFPPKELTVSVLDIGQGESIFIEFPNGKTLLMDGGGFYKNSPDVGKIVIAPFLWNRGIDHIDYMVATHSDNDHIRGLDSVLDLFPVKTFLTFGDNIAGFRMKRLYAKAKEKNTQLVSLKRGQAFQIGETELTPLHPGPNESINGNTRRVDNDLSLVLRLDYQSFSMLFTGDIGKKIEERLVNFYSELKVNVLKSPHHGSRFSNSASFIEATRPDAVVFSSGYLNRMNHPHPKTLDRYKNSGVNIYRTDLNGAVQIISNGQKYSIRTHEGL
ncbi:MAG: competence protein ComEC [Nitrospinales bacterium]|jgi:competence protein ComEC